MNSKLRAFREEQKLSILEMSKSLGVSKWSMVKEPLVITLSNVLNSNTLLQTRTLFFLLSATQKMCDS